MTVSERTREIIRLALLEDIGDGDITAEATVPASLGASGTIIAKEDGVLAGLGAAELVFDHVDSATSFQAGLSDGDPLSAGKMIAKVEGRARSILTSERVALNFLMHLSGVATLTRAFVDRVQRHGVEILDTRKTMPGLRELEKEAVLAGGGKNHRMGLWDEFLVKNNHIAAAGGIKDAVAAAKEKKRGRTLVVEVRNMKELEDALRIGGIDRVLLDNMSASQMKEAIDRIRSTSEGTHVEISGGVTLDTVEEFASLRPDYISVGSITHSARSVNMSLALSLSKS